MDELLNLLSKPRAILLSYVERLRSLIFGANNERLDFLLDSFYKLDNRERVAILTGVISGITVIVAGIIGFYFYQISSLKAELNDSFAALHQFERLKSEYQAEQSKFEDLSDRIFRKTSELKLKPYIEKLGREIGVQIEVSDEKKEAIEAENPLSERVDYLNAELRIQKVSIPRLLKVISELEKSDYLLSVKTMEIKSIFGQKLFFSSKVVLRGYAPRNG